MTNKNISISVNETTTIPKAKEVSILIHTGENVSGVISVPEGYQKKQGKAVILAYAPWELEIIEGGDHSFRTPKSMGLSETDIYHHILNKAIEWLNTNSA
jgi:dienelactone hydrolase